MDTGGLSMGGTGSPGRPGSAGRYLSGLGAAGLGLCAAGWLVLTPFAFGYRGRLQDAAVTNLATGGGLAAVCLVTLAATTVAWRRALRADGVLPSAPRARIRARRRVAREAAVSPAPAPDQVLTALRELLAPVLIPPVEPAGDEPAAPAPDEPARRPAPAELTMATAGAVIPEPRNAAERPYGIAAIESMLARTELPIPGYEDEETW